MTKWNVLRTQDAPDTGTVDAVTVTSGPGPASVCATIVIEYVVLGSSWRIFLSVWSGSSTTVIIGALPLSTVTFITTTLIQLPAFRDRLGKPVPECQTVRTGFCCNKRDGGGGTDNWKTKTCQAPVRSSSLALHCSVILQARCPSHHPTVSKQWRLTTVSRELHNILLMSQYKNQNDTQ